MTKDSITVSKLTLWQGITGVLAVLFVLSIATGGFGFGSMDDVRDGTGSAVQQRTQAQAPSLESFGDNGRELGSPDAKVVVTKYSSFSCGFCARAAPTVKQLVENYDDVKLVYKHFDRGGPDGRAAQATECAGEQGQFWDMHDMIFERGASGNVEAYARDIGLDMSEFNECLNSGKYAALVAQHTSEARALGFSGTPSFTINDQNLVGAQPYENFAAVVDQELARLQ